MYVQEYLCFLFLVSCFLFLVSCFVSRSRCSVETKAKKDMDGWMAASMMMMMMMSLIQILFLFTGLYVSNFSTSSILVQSLDNVPSS